MKVHTAHVWFLKYWRVILFFMTAIGVMTTMVVAFISLGQIYRQSKRNEQTLKALSCILLINPTDRTKTNFQACIDHNSGGKSKFEFKATEDFRRSDTSQKNSTISAHLAGPAILPINPAPEPMIIQAQTASAPPPQQQPQPEQTSLAPRPQETRTNPDTGAQEVRYVGEKYWRVIE